MENSRFSLVTKKKCCNTRIPGTESDNGRRGSAVTMGVIMTRGQTGLQMYLCNHYEYKSIANQQNKKRGVAKMGKMEQRKVRKRETNLTQATIRRLRETTHYCLRHCDILKLLLLKKTLYNTNQRGGVIVHIIVSSTYLRGKKKKGVQVICFVLFVFMLSISSNHVRKMAPHDVWQNCDFTAK